ncbi:hypothetical protein CHS0354_020172 [Potamilus streckersoni]|uniref:Uncharacterized protein n=1 Tax=Potamilus streckersoni TaxID=2493646 RepID=A0AAE0VGP6_9BIVA|nr:hypothetical protein CHS0354_020172 [Potamilus streckersoni]
MLRYWFISRAGPEAPAGCPPCPRLGDDPLGKRLALAGCRLGQNTTGRGQGDKAPVRADHTALQVSRSASPSPVAVARAYLFVSVYGKCPCVCN